MLNQRSAIWGSARKSFTKPTSSACKRRYPVAVESDRSDVERLLALYQRSIDLERVRGLVREFAVALDEPERVEEFEALVRRALA
jgi:hypothetical protein